MRSFHRALLAAAAAAALALPLVPGLRADDQAGTEPRDPSSGTGDSSTGGTSSEPATDVALKMEVAPEFKFRTPRDGRKGPKESTVRGCWDDVSGGELPIRGVKGGLIKFELRAPVIAIDLDGDGNLESSGKQEIWTVKAAHADGSTTNYSFKLRRDANFFFVSRACMATGEIAKTPIQIVDENNDGKFNGIGQDAIHIGNAPSAQPLSRIVNVKGDLYEIAVDEGGTKLTYRKWTGPAGTLDLCAGYKGKSKPTLAVVSRGDLYFDCSQKGGSKVPAGDYDFSIGHVGPSRDQFAVIEKGNMTSISVKPDETTTPDWGTPGKIEFLVTKQGNLMNIGKKSVHAFGKGGEAYTEWIPAGFKTNCEIIEEASGKRIFYGIAGDGTSQRLVTTVAWKVRLMNDMVLWLGPFASDWQ